jgi:hypothetical protein
MAVKKETRELVVKFTKERATKNTVRFNEDTPPDQDVAVGALYVKKAAYAALGNPTALTVTIAVG